MLNNKFPCSNITWLASLFQVSFIILNRTRYSETFNGLLPKPGDLALLVLFIYLVGRFDQTIPHGSTSHSPSILQSLFHLGLGNVSAVDIRRSARTFVDGMKVRNACTMSRNKQVLATCCRLTSWRVKGKTNQKRGTKVTSSFPYFSLINLNEQIHPN